MTKPRLKPNPDSLGSSPFRKTYTSFSADIDLVAEGGDVCRLITINAAGSGAIALAGILDATTSPPTEWNDTQTGRQQGDELKVKASKILASGTTVTSVTVDW